MNDMSHQFEWMGMTFQTILSNRATGGAMSIIDSTVPDGAGPPRHVHDAEDETFVILEGRCKLWLDGTHFELGLGESAFVLRGTEHTFKVIGGVPCRQLVILTPGGFEGYCEEMAKGQFRIPEDMAAVNESAERFNLRFTGPPLD